MLISEHKAGKGEEIFFLLLAAGMPINNNNLHDFHSSWRAKIPSAATFFQFAPVWEPKGN